MVRIHTDYGVGSDLMHDRLDGGETRKHASVELDVIAVAEVGNDVFTETEPECERVIAVVASEGIVARTDVENVVAVAAAYAVIAVSDGHPIVAITAVDGVITVGG